MRHAPLLSSIKGAHFFFTTTPLPCPYFSDRVEKRVITELIGPGSQALHEALTRAGYRRSHGIAYAPTCPGCNDCISVRIRAHNFTLSRSQRKLVNRNSDLEVMEVPPVANEEQFALFSTYQMSRHAGGDMANMDYSDYRSLVEESAVDTALIEFRDQEKLIAVLLVDKLSDGFSAVYSFFDTEFNSRKSLGTYMVLWLARHAKELDLSYVYLGFWIPNCRKMSYKTDFQPLEEFVNGHWREAKRIKKHNRMLPLPDKEARVLNNIFAAASDLFMT